jgi:hypothetical protein
LFASQLEVEESENENDDFQLDLPLPGGQFAFVKGSFRQKTVIADRAQVADKGRKVFLSNAYIT